MVGLAVLSLVMTLSSAHDGSIGIGLIVGFVALGVFALGYGVYFAGDKARRTELTFNPSSWRTTFLGATAVLGITFSVYLLIVEPRHLVYASLWPILVGQAIGSQFRPGGQRFQLVGQWPTGMSRATALETLASDFEQPGLSSKVVDRELWLEISKDWKPTNWRHQDAVRFMKIRPVIRLKVSESDTGSTIEAYSQGHSLIGMYDVLKLAEEMSAAAVALAKEATA